MTTLRQAVDDRDVKRALRRVAKEPHTCWTWYELAKATGAQNVGDLADIVGVAEVERHTDAATSGLAQRLDRWEDARGCDHYYFEPPMPINERDIAATPTQRGERRPQAPPPTGERGPTPRQAGGLADMGVDVGEA